MADLPPIPDPACTFADHSYPAYSKRQVVEYAQAAVAAVEAPGWHPTHRHVKRGTEYQLIGRAIIQTTAPLNDDEYVVVYRGEDGQRRLCGT